MQVTVITHEPMDFGHGADTRVTFDSAKFHVQTEDEGGRLIIQPDPAATSGPAGNVATFQRHEWRCVVRGDVVAHPPVSDVEGGA